MFWSKKKKDESITDPVTRYGKMIRNSRAGKKGAAKLNKITNKILPRGCDKGFVYYEE